MAMQTRNAGTGRASRDLPGAALRAGARIGKAGIPGTFAAFQALLQLPDPDLVGYLLNKQMPATELQRVVEHILERTDT